MKIGGGNLNDNDDVGIIIYWSYVIIDIKLAHQRSHSKRVQSEIVLRFTQKDSAD